MHGSGNVHSINHGKRDTYRIIHRVHLPASSMASSTGVDDTASPSSPCLTTPSPDAANISVREYIYFLPYPLPPGTPVPYTPGLPSHNPLDLPTICFEPTSTLVLTSPNHTFVDIRLFKPQQPTDSASALPNQAEAGRLEWAFAGFSTSVDVMQKEGYEEGVRHAVWTHWLDSRYPFGAATPPDQGDMYPLSADLTLEVGHAFHPALGAVHGHEELWRDVAVRATPSSSTNNSARTSAKVAVTLRLDNPAAALRGLVVRVGQYAQGIVVHGNAVTAERWEYDDSLPLSKIPHQHQQYHHQEKSTLDHEPPTMYWKRTARIGDAYVPCPVTFRPEVLEVGARVRCGANVWEVEEVWEW